MRRPIPGLLAATLLLGATPAAGQGAAAIPFEKYSLDNGLEVILAPDRSVPVVAVDVWYKVGAANEQPGLTGFAHLFEHMMFQGSANVGKGEHMQLLERAGADFNGSTGDDRTNYYQTLPANRLNLALWLEADRMRSLNVSMENLQNQREVVKEERRLRLDNSPYGASIVAALSTVPYNAQGCFAYAHEGIGSMDDLNAAKLEDVQRFFDTYYAPTNATLTVVGDFDPAATRAIIQEYFGAIPRGPAVPTVRCETPFAHLPVRRVFEDRNANLPGVFAAYGLPAAGHPDTYPLRLLAAVLADGESSRLNRALVRDQQAALQVFNFPDFRRGPGLFLVGAIANQGVEVARLESLIEQQMASVREAGISQAELDKAKAQYRSSTIRGLQTAFGRAEALQEANFKLGDPAALRAELDRTLAVSLDDIRRVANHYLAPGNRATVITQPAAAQE